jgi:hypothetical protein
LAAGFATSFFGSAAAFAFVVFFAGLFFLVAMSLSQSPVQVGAALERRPDAGPVTLW